MKYKAPSLKRYCRKCQKLPIFFCSKTMNYHTSFELNESFLGYKSKITTFDVIEIIIMGLDTKKSHNFVTVSNKNDQ